MADISPNVVILTRSELQAREDAAFQRGVERGKFEAGHVSTKVARNCKYWFNGRCEACGVQHQYFEVNQDFACPSFSPRVM